MRHWRLLRGLTQESLGEGVGLTQKHVSNIETDKVRPTEATACRLIEALRLPSRDGNALLGLLGHAAAFPEPEVEEGDAHLFSVAEHMLRGVDPCPAAVVDRRHLMVRLNLSMARFFDRFARAPDAFAHGCLQYPVAVTHPEGMRANIENWESFAPAYLQVLHREKLRNPLLTDALYQQVLDQPGVPDSWKVINDSFAPVGARVLEAKTPTGIAHVAYVTLVVTPPAAHVEARVPGFYFGMLDPVGDVDRERLSSLVDGFTSKDVHPALLPALVAGRNES